MPSSPEATTVELQRPLAALFYLLKWFVLAAPLAVMVGSACALFLWSLDQVTQLRFQQPWLVWLLPIAGMVIVWLYQTWGSSVAAGNNLIIDEIHEPGAGVPLRMAPLVLVGTLITHLCGGSAGREGTAVQMGGGIAGGYARLLPMLSQTSLRTLLMAGVAAGFGGVFGTPVAGAIFALEVLTVGRLHHAALLPCLFAAILSDQTCRAWGVGHTHYHIASSLVTGAAEHLAPVSLHWLLATVLTGAACGLASLLFAELAHRTHSVFQRTIRWPLLRPVVGGLLILTLMSLLGTRNYLGLGVTSPDPHAVTILSSFEPGGAAPLSWWWKILFTVITLGSGFKGGEVTPLFFIGATLGHTVGQLCGVPVDLVAGVGLVAIFAGAAKTPLACTVMAVELFGGEYVLYHATGCLLAYGFSGPTGIYLAQRVGNLRASAVRQSRSVTPGDH